ncbi:hypothetical protein FLL71_19410 [Vibrio cholerae]|nr:hypothetical protein FLL71_19410 [Vibrio cholerae]
MVHMVHTYWLNWSFGSTLKNLRPNNRLKRDCQRAAFPVPLSRSGALLRNSRELNPKVTI